MTTCCAASRIGCSLRFAKPLARSREDRRGRVRDSRARPARRRSDQAPDAAVSPRDLKIVEQRHQRHGRASARADQRLERLGIELLGSNRNARRPDRSGRARPCDRRRDHRAPPRAPPGVPDSARGRAATVRLAGCLPRGCEAPGPRGPLRRSACAGGRRSRVWAGSRLDANPTRATIRRRSRPRPARSRRFRSPARASFETFSGKAPVKRGPRHAGLQRLPGVESFERREQLAHQTLGRRLPRSGSHRRARSFPPAPARRGAPQRSDVETGLEREAIRADALRARPLDAQPDALRRVPRASRVRSASSASSRRLRWGGAMSSTRRRRGCGRSLRDARSRAR